MIKIWTIAWKELYTTFTDRNLILIMLATPLALSTIMGLAFGGLGGGDVPIQDIPIAILNQDQDMAGGFNFGQVYLDLLAPGEGQDAEGGALPACDLPPVDAAGSDQAEPGEGVSLLELTEAVAFDAALARQLISSGGVSLPENASQGTAGADFTRAVARAAVDQGVYTAAVFIPMDFTTRLTEIGADEAGEPLEISIYANGGQPISAGIVRSIIDGITNQLITGNITIAAAFSHMAASGAFPTPGASTGSIDFGEVFACAFTPASNTITLDVRTVEAQEDQNIASIILVSVGSSSAMFFALFTAQFGIFSMYDERRNWTLQRILTSPTPKAYILAGKLIGVFVTVLVQLLLLMIALSVVGSFLQGRPTLIWGTNYPMIALVLVSAALAVSGFGMLLAGVASTPEQGQVYGSVLNIAMAALGGAFGFTLPRAVSAFSLLYWGRDAFDRLAVGQTDIWLNVVVLVVLGVLMYLVGLLLFNRRFEL